MRKEFKLELKLQTDLNAREGTLTTTLENDGCSSLVSLWSQHRFFDRQDE